MLAARIVDAFNRNNSYIFDKDAIVLIDRKQSEKDRKEFLEKYEERKSKNGFLESMRIAQIEFVEKLLNEH